MQKISTSIFYKFSLIALTALTIASFTSIVWASNDFANDQDSRLHVFTGYDRRAPIGHHVCEQSIMDHCSQPIAVTPLYLETVKHIFTREKTSTQLTDFTYSRFIVPAICHFKGWSLFIDGNDMLIREDLATLWNLRDEKYAVMVVKHPDVQLSTLL